MSVSDDMNRPDNASLGANWTNIRNAPRITSNAVRGNTGGAYSLAYWSANTFNNDQSASITLPASWAEAGPIVRFTGADSGYTAMAHASNLRRIYRVDSGSYNLLANYDGTLASSDTIKLDVSGTTLDYRRNGSSLGTTTDATYSSGSAGLYVFGDTTVIGCDNWTGTGEVAAVTVRPFAPRVTRQAVNRSNSF